MKIKGKLMDAEGMKNTFRRLAHQIIEKNEGVENLVLIGIRTRGVTVAERIKACLDSIEGENVPMGVFDIALYRDDLEDLGSEVEFFGSEIDFSVDQLLALVDRGHRELPFKADFTGKSVPSSAKEGIAVRFTETDGEDGVFIYDK